MVALSTSAGSTWREGRNLIGRFLVWWWRELSTLLPTSIRKLWRRERWFVLVAETHGRSIAWQSENDAPVIVAANADAGHGDLRRVAGGAPVAVLVPAAQVWRRQLALPKAAEASLRPILQNLLERETPFLASDVVFDHRVVARDDAARQLTVELAILRREHLNAAMDEAHALGLAPRLIGLAVADEWPPAFNFLPKDPAAPRGPRLATRVLAALAAGLALACLWQWHAHQTAMASLIDREMAAARAEASAASQTREAVEVLMRQRRFLTDRHRQPSALQLLDELSRVLPDGAWASELRLQDGAGQVIGYAPSASALIERFAQAALVGQPRFRSPVTPGPQAGLERFDIGFSMRATP